MRFVEILEKHSRFPTLGKELFQLAIELIGFALRVQIRRSSEKKAWSKRSEARVIEEFDRGGAGQRGGDRGTSGHTGVSPHGLIMRDRD